MEDRFENYIKKIISELDCSKDEKQEIKIEIYDHLSMLKKEHLDKGLSEMEAIDQAIKDFGEEKKLGKLLQSAMFPHSKILKWSISIISIILIVFLIKEGIALWNMGTVIDGAGIGVYFLFLEINDKVPSENIPSYAVGYFIASFVAALIPLYLFKREIKEIVIKN